MNKTLSEAVDLATALKVELQSIKDIDVVLCPPATHLLAVYDVIKDSHIELGGQNLYWESAGAFTGEVSAEMLKSVGCRYVIIGHSERRQYFHETDATVNKKVHRALQSDLKPIMCVGETLEQRETGVTDQVLEQQVQGGLAGLSAKAMEQMVIAYEPVWAIGTGRTATTAQAQDAHHFIRDLIQKMFDKNTAENILIQYGGSVKPDNAKSLLTQPDVDGALVGGASLDVKSFVGIIKANL